MRGRDAAWKLTLVMDIFTSIHDRFLRDPVRRESQPAIGWTEQTCKEMDELAKEDHTYHLTPEEYRRYQGQRYLTLNKAGKNWPIKLLSDFRAAVSIKNRISQENQLKSPTIQVKTVDGIPLQAHRGGTNLMSSLEFVKWSSFCYSWFRLQSMAMHCNWRGCRQIHLPRHFSHAVCTIHFMHITLHGSRRATQCVCVRASFHLHAIYDVCLIVRSLSVSSCSSFSCFFSVVSLFSSTLYLHSDQPFISNVNSVEGNNRCAFAQ